MNRILGLLLQLASMFAVSLSALLACFGVVLIMAHDGLSGIDRWCNQHAARLGGFPLAPDDEEGE